MSSSISSSDSSISGSGTRLPRRRARGFLALFLTGMLGTLALVVGGLALLEALGRLPPPSLSGRWDVDLTLKRWRDQGVPRAELLFAGSSAAFYGIDGREVRAALGDSVRFLNIGVLGAKMHQTRMWLEFVLGLQPEVRRVVLMSTYIDFEACPPRTARLFDPTEARALIARRFPLVYHHLRHLAPLRLMRDVVDWPRRLQLGPDTLETRRLEPWGGQVLTVTRERVPPKIVRGIFPQPDPRCYAALGAIARMLDRRGIESMFVLVPMRPGYLAAYDPDGRGLRAHMARVRATLAGTGMAVVDLHQELALPEEAFFDAYHLRAPWVRLQTRALMARLLDDREPPLARADRTYEAEILRASASPAARLRLRQISP